LGGGQRNQIKRFEKVRIYLGNKIFFTFIKKTKFYYLSFLIKINTLSIMNNKEGRIKKQNAIKDCVNFIRRFHCKGNVLAEKLKAILGTLEFREAHFDYRCSRLCKFRITAKPFNRIGGRLAQSV
jgi:hypothetical protein